MALGWLFRRPAPPAPRPRAPLRLYNTLSASLEEFVPLRPPRVGLYSCGPTVYDVQHIGNLRAYIFADVLRRVLEWNGYEVKQVVNITDVGHLTSDADEGEDKVELGARRSGKRVADVVREVTDAFLKDLERLNVPTKRIFFPRASEHVGEQIALAQTLEEKGYTYRTTDGLYFDTAKFHAYGALGGINLEDLREGARVAPNPEKRHPTDFALWKLSRPPGRREQEWKSPWGVGFPGWHLECSAMAMKHLGRSFDIHTGGIDHIPIHHNNEIAQSEAATGKRFVRYWLHNAFLTIEGKKISKSLGNTLYLRNLVDRGFSPLAFRYWLLTGHYRSPMNFTWEALEGAQAAFFRLHRHFVEKLGARKGAVAETYEARFEERINDDLDLPGAVALLWEVVKDDSLAKPDARATLLAFDRVLGIGLSQSHRKIRNMLAGIERKLPIASLPEDIRNLLGERERAREKGDFADADRIREELRRRGYAVEDTPAGPAVRAAEELSPR